MHLQNIHFIFLTIFQISSPSRCIPSIYSICLYSLLFLAEVMVNDSPVHITLCDTAGQDTLDPLRELCYPDSNVFMLCFSLVKPESFQSIKDKWIPKFSKTKAALVLVGTQADLRSDNFMLNKLQVSWMKDWDQCFWFKSLYRDIVSGLLEIGENIGEDIVSWDNKCL